MILTLQCTDDEELRSQGSGPMMAVESQIHTKWVGILERWGSVAFGIRYPNYSRYLL